MKRWLEALWYTKHPLRWGLYPFSLLYLLLSEGRGRYLRRFKQQSFPVPVIVVGNISVGGAGKTPLVIAIAHYFQRQGLNVGVVSRGYKAKSKRYPRQVLSIDLAEEVGDEPLLIVQKTQCPLVIDPDRVRDLRHLIKNNKVQLVISDDGLQHYRMGRTVEIAVVDGARGLGNGLCLPAGPLRERAHRLNQVDMVLKNSNVAVKSDEMSLECEGLYQLSTGKKIPFGDLKKPIVAVAGIGNPKRFYDTLQAQGVDCQFKGFPDHYRFRPKDIENLKAASIIMTEKDAVKCGKFSKDHTYYLAVNARLSDAAWDKLTSILQQKIKSHAF